jgi:hypothetical protein
MGIKELDPRCKWERRGRTATLEVVCTATAGYPDVAGPSAVGVAFNASRAS